MHGTREKEKKKQKERKATYKGLSKTKITQNPKIQNIYSTLLQGGKKRGYLQDVLKGRSIVTQEVFFQDDSQ